jgi:endoglucanase
MEDLLSLWEEVNWGNALWNLKGSFGVLNSGRSDVKYENYKGHKLDRKMLELLKKYQ